jgi:fatty-acyl-CoA synthase
VKAVAAQAAMYASLGEALSGAASSSAGVTFVDLREREETLSWAEVRRRALHVAAALANLGVLPGERVALVLPTGPSFLDAFFGATLAGAVPVPLAPPPRLGRVHEYQAATARMIGAAGARLVLTDARAKPVVDGAVAAAPPDLGCHLAALLVDHADTHEVRAHADAIAVIQFSSGSTVDPKPVALTHRNVLAQLAAIDQVTAPQAPGDLPQTGVSWLPMHHDMGLIGCLLGALYQAIPLVLMAPEVFLVRPALWLRAIARHRATASAAPSFAYAACAKRVDDADLEGMDLSSWRFALNGAEPVSVGVLDQFAERFARFGFDARALTPVYGMAEASLAVTFSPPGRAARSVGVDPVTLAKAGLAVDGPRRIASVGVAMPGVEVTVRDEAGRDVGERRVGRIWVRGPSVMAGYFADPAATARVLIDGCLDTGDLGFVAEGELYICGRAKDVVIIRGANHAPQEFEECLDAVPGVRPGCAVALGFVPLDADARSADGEALLILAERAGTSPGESPASISLPNEIRAAILERTGVRAHTVCVLAQGTLPRTTSGKLRRAEALRRFLAGELAAPRNVSKLRVGQGVARSGLPLAESTGILDVG